MWGHSIDPAITVRRTTLEKQLAADHETPDHMKHRQLQALGRRESKYVLFPRPLGTYR